MRKFWSYPGLHPELNDFTFSKKQSSFIVSKCKSMTETTMMKLLMAMVYVLVLHSYTISFDIWITIDSNQSISHTPKHAYISKVGLFSIYSICLL